MHFLKNRKLYIIYYIIGYYILYNRMINICIYCNPVYKNKHKHIAGKGSCVKKIDVVTQAIILCNSINKNWNSFKYDITLFYNKNIKWSNYDWTRINKLNFLNIIPITTPDHPNIPWQTRIPCFTHELKNKGTHRLVLDCDLIALEEPEFDLTCDWQAMYSISGHLPHKVYKGYPLYKKCNGNCFFVNENKKNKIKDFLQKNNFKLSKSCLKHEKNNLQKCHIHTEYHNNIDYHKLYPHFNFGAILLKEKLCKKFGKYYKLAYRVTEIGLPPHCATEYAGTYILKTLSDNWKPFKPGFNLLSPCFSKKKINFLLKNKKISLIHYPGGFALEDYKTQNFSVIDEEYQKIYGISLLKIFT